MAQFDGGATGLTALVAGEHSGVLTPVPIPAVLAILPGPERPRYPHPARIAVAWDEGKVEVWPAVDLGLADLTPDTELGGLILGPERIRGQVIGGTAADAAKAVVDLLRTRRVA